MFCYEIFYKYKNKFFRSFGLGILHGHHGHPINHPSTAFAKGFNAWLCCCSKGYPKLTGRDLRNTSAKCNQALTMMSHHLKGINNIHIMQSYTYIVYIYIYIYIYIFQKIKKNSLETNKYSPSLHMPPTQILSFHPWIKHNWTAWEKNSGTLRGLMAHLIFQYVQMICKHTVSSAPRKKTNCKEVLYRSNSCTVIPSSLQNTWSAAGTIK